MFLCAKHEPCKNEKIHQMSRENLVISEQYWKNHQQKGGFHTLPSRNRVKNDDDLGICLEHD